MYDKIKDTYFTKSLFYIIVILSTKQQEQKIKNGGNRKNG